jgi:hypothetical protein
LASNSIHLTFLPLTPVIMKNIFLIITLGLLLFALASCVDHDLETAEPIDKEKVFASLTAPQRYWCIEGITRQVGNQILEISEDTAYLSPIQIYLAHANAYRFLGDSEGRVIFESPQANVGVGTFDYSKSLWGKRPYGVHELHIRDFFIYAGPWHGKWDWNEEQKKFPVQFPSEPFLFWRPGVGYLDPTLYPHYNNLAEAQAAGQPERIRIIMEEDDANLGKVTYAYTLRAAWVIERLQSGPRELSLYKVLY